jgi:hypothetical protein
MASVDSRLIDTSQMAREGSAIFIRSQQVRDQTIPSLSSCRLNKQRLINELVDGVNERHCWHNHASPDYRPKFRLSHIQDYVTQKVIGAHATGLRSSNHVP